MLCFECGYKLPQENIKKMIRVFHAKNDTEIKIIKKRREEEEIANIP